MKKDELAYSYDSTIKKCRIGIIAENAIEATKPAEGKISVWRATNTITTPNGNIYLKLKLMMNVPKNSKL